MQQKLSYLNINAKDLKALYKYYYIKKLTNNITKVGNSFEKEHTTFIFYGTMIAITPIKRMECNKFFNKNKEAVSVDFSIMPYSNFKSLIRFSNLNKMKHRLKGEVFYQMEIKFVNKYFIQDKISTNFENQAIRYTSILSWFNQYINPKTEKKTGYEFFPSIIYVPSGNEVMSSVRYSSIYKWSNHFESITDKRLSINMMQICQYSQNQLIEVLFYNQSKKLTN